MDYLSIAVSNVLGPSVLHGRFFVCTGFNKSANDPILVKNLYDRDLCAVVLN